MASSSVDSLPRLRKSLELTHIAAWFYETDEFHGICELAGDEMVVKCCFESYDRSFYDVLAIDGVIRHRLGRPVSVERLAEQLAEDFPDLTVTVKGRAKTHGWISSTVKWAT